MIKELLHNLSFNIIIRNNKLSLICLILFLLGSSCSDDEEVDSIESTDNLATYITQSNLQLISDSLIACAFGNEAPIFESDTHPISILFYPEGNASDFKYFETENISSDPEDLDSYKALVLEDEPFFNGYLHRFLRDETSDPKWCRVTYIKNGQLFISNAIHLKFNDLPTESNPTLLTINQNDILSPIFSWSDGNIQENAIYFHAVLDSSGNLISGTYTFEKTFQFYNLSNVVLNIRDINPPPALTINENYEFVLMGVSIDNWVNLILNIPFKTK